MIRFMNTEIKDERLVLDSKTEVYYLGQGVILRGCTLILRVPARALVVANARFIDCSIEVKQELKNFRWDAAVFEGCRISGKFLGNDFGSWPGSNYTGGIEGCDLTAARLHLCRFVGCDASTLRFPRWPCFTLLDTYRRGHELETLKLPWRQGLPLSNFTEDPPTTAAVSFVATALAKEYGVSEEEIRAFVERLDGVVY